MTDSDGSRLFSAGRGKVGRKTRRAIRDAAAAGRITGSAEVLAGMAEWTADLVDGSVRAHDSRAFLAACKRLDELLARLPLDEPSVVSGESGDAGSGGDGDAGGLARILGAGPTVGDAEVA